MDRKEELTNLIPEESRELVNELIDNIVGMETRLTELKKLPFYKVNPKDATMQKVLPAQKMYKELLQQYTNCLKLLESIIYRDKRLEGIEEEDSPLRKWFNDHVQ